MITGGSGGIGAAIAAELGRRGWRCVLLARREERLREVAAACNGEYEVCDVSNRAAVEAVAARLRERHPRIGLLVNNAGIPGRGGFLDIEPDKLEALVRTNFFAGVWCLRAFLPALEAAGRSDVVNIVSVAGTVAVPASGPYAAAKHAQLAFSRAVGPELRPRGVRVHTVNPGFVETEGFPQRIRMRNQMVASVVIDAEDVARHVMRVLERDRTETFVPWWYRIPAIGQALVPGLVSRVLAARHKQRPSSK